MGDTATQEFLQPAGIPGAHPDDRCVLFIGNLRDLDGGVSGPHDHPCPDIPDRKIVPDRLQMTFCLFYNITCFNPGFVPGNNMEEDNFTNPGVVAASARAWSEYKEKSTGQRILQKTIGQNTA